jgi:hypothetical protein
VPLYEQASDRSLVAEGFRQESGPTIRSTIISPGAVKSALWNCRSVAAHPDSGPPLSKGSSGHQLLSRHRWSDRALPNGGIFGTGFKMWGLSGTARVLIEYTEKATIKGLLLEPVDVKNDRYGFIYAPTRNAHGLYNPVRNASAYRR